MLNLVTMTDALGVSTSLSLSLLLEGLLGRGLLPRVADGWMVGVGGLFQ